MSAAAENDLQLANILLEYKCRIELKDNFQRNALFYSINTKNGDPSAMINLLVTNGIEINEPDVEGHTPLTLAVTKGLKNVVNILLDHGADVNYRNIKDGNTPLHYVAIMNNVDIVYTLLSRKPILCIRNKNEQTPMEVAATCAKTEIYQIFAEEYNKKEAKINENSISIGNNSGEFFTDPNLIQDEFRSNISVTNPYANANQGKLNQMSNKINSNPNLQNDKNFSSNYNQINNINSHQHNIQININNLSHNETQKNQATANCFGKSAKLQKLHFLQEKRNSEKNSGRSIKDKVFKFPFNQSSNNPATCNNIEIPFSFQNCIERNNKSNTGNQLHSYISKYCV